MYFYFLTIDKAVTSDGIKPTKDMYMDIFFKLKNITKISFTKGLYPIKCFELKEKGSIKKKNKVYDWLHFHCIVICNTKVIYSTIKGFSIVWKPIYDLQTMAFYAGYIQKDKIDKSELLLNKLKKANNKICIAKRDIRSYYELHKNE